MIWVPVSEDSVDKHDRTKALPLYALKTFADVSERRVYIAEYK
jgi:hypothetical protein